MQSQQQAKIITRENEQVSHQQQRQYPEYSYQQQQHQKNFTVYHHREYRANIIASDQTDADTGDGDCEGHDVDEDEEADQILQAIMNRVCTRQQNVYTFRQQDQRGSEEQTTTDDSDDQIQTSIIFTRRREQKTRTKITSHCFGCRQDYIRVDQQNQLCHNCIKMYQAVRRTIASNRGTYVYDRKTATFQIVCQEGHNWTVRLEARKGRGWCRICASIARMQHKQQIRQELEQARRERATQEELLFQEAAQNEQIRTEIYEEEKVDHQVQQVQQVIYAIQRRQEHRITAEQIQQLTDNIIQIDEEQMIRVIHSIAEEHRERVHRHIKSILHPDKNKGAYATEAFQKYNNLMSLFKPPSLSKPFSYKNDFNNWQYLLRGLETLNIACAAA